MAQLAEICGISASTLSRAVNGKITKPMPAGFISGLPRARSGKRSVL